MTPDQKSYLIALLYKERRKIRKQLNLCGDPDSFRNLCESLNMLEKTYTAVTLIKTNDE